MDALARGSSLDASYLEQCLSRQPGSVETGFGIDVGEQIDEACGVADVSVEEGAQPRRLQHHRGR